jgi:hypothetical protein
MLQGKAFAESVTLQKSYQNRIKNVTKLKALEALVIVRFTSRCVGENVGKVSAELPQKW